MYTENFLACSLAALRVLTSSLAIQMEDTFRCSGRQTATRLPNLPSKYCCTSAYMLCIASPSTSLHHASKGIQQQPSLKVLLRLSNFALCSNVNNTLKLTEYSLDLCAHKQSFHPSCLRSTRVQSNAFVCTAAIYRQPVRGQIMSVCSLAVCCQAVCGPADVLVRAYLTGGM